MNFDLTSVVQLETLKYCLCVYSECVNRQIFADILALTAKLVKMFSVCSCENRTNQCWIKFLNVLHFSVDCDVFKELLFFICNFRIKYVPDRGGAMGGPGCAQAHPD